MKDILYSILNVFVPEFVFAIILAIIIICTTSLLVFLIIYIKSPFSFPYKNISFDVTGTRQPNIYDYIDDYLIKHGMFYIDNHNSQLAQWKKDCIAKIQKSPFKTRRTLQYNQCLDENKMFIFSFTREQTRYKQINYVRHPYKVVTEVESFPCSYSFLVDRYKQLETINFETTLSSFHSKQQRSLMTKDLKNSIAIRDDYTCQICGKYMPDGVGLHIDHIVPIAKGGKSIPSNLQVLCSKCNGKKSSKSVDNNNLTNSTDNANLSFAQTFKNSEENINYTNTYLENLQTIEHQIILAYQNQEFDTVIDLINRAEKMQHTTLRNSISLHFFYQNVANIVYSMRNIYDNAVKECLVLCDKDIELLSNIDFGAGCSILTITRKAIILEKEKEYFKAIELCDYAISKNYLDNKLPFNARKARLEAKLKKEQN